MSINIYIVIYVHNHGLGTCNVPSGSSLYPSRFKYVLRGTGIPAFFNLSYITRLSNNHSCSSKELIAYGLYFAQ